MDEKDESQDTPEEEYQCYATELKFLKMLPYVEPDLLQYTQEQIQFWNIK